MSEPNQEAVFDAEREPETIGEEQDRLATEKADYANNRDRQNREEP